MGYRLSETEAKLAADRLKIPAAVLAPKFPTLSIVIWLVAALCWGYVAINRHRWIVWLMVVLAISAVSERLFQYAGEKKRYTRQRQAASGEVS